MCFILQVAAFLLCFGDVCTKDEKRKPVEHLKEYVPITTATLDLKMPGALPKVHDSYICSSFDISELLNISVIHVTGFKTTADSSKAHHVLLYSCNLPIKQPGVVYDCFHHSLCNDAISIMFAWAKNAPPANLPNEVSFEASAIKKRFFVLQVHYNGPLPSPDYTVLSLTYQTEATKYQAGILLLLTSDTIIPPNTPVTHSDVSCQLSSKNPLHMFAFRTHAHSLGSVITGYVINDTVHSYREIARGNPQWPQAFYPMKKVETVNPGEYVAARCTFNSMGVNKMTIIGATAGDEMCNLYIMFYTEPGEADDSIVCVDEEAGSSITRGLPANSDTPLPRNISYEDHAKDKNKGATVQLNYAKLFNLKEKEIKGSSKKKGGLDEVAMIATYNMTMPAVKPTRHDHYICTAYSIANLSDGRKLWINGFSVLSSSKKAHHMILSRCKHPVKKIEGRTWDCRQHSLCQGPSKILFAWGNGANTTELPNDVGFNLDPNDFLVLQVQYAHPSHAPDSSGISLTFVNTAPKYTAGMYLLFRTKLHIPGNTPLVHGDINCVADISSPIHVFAYRTHAHSLGNVISAYRYMPFTDHWTMLAKANPQWPQAFYPMDTMETIYPGEILAARCTYNSIGVSKDTEIGTKGEDEMCNLYLMYYTRTKADDFKFCADEGDPGVSSKLPEGNDVPVPFNKLLDEKSQTGIKFDEDHDIDESSNGILILVLLLTSFTICFVCCVCFRRRKHPIKGLKGKRHDANDDVGRRNKGFLPLMADCESDDDVFPSPLY